MHEDFEMTHNRGLLKLVGSSKTKDSDNGESADTEQQGSSGMSESEVSLTVDVRKEYESCAIEKRGTRGECKVEHDCIGATALQEFCDCFHNY